MIYKETETFQILQLPQSKFAHLVVPEKPNECHEVISSLSTFWFSAIQRYQVNKIEHFLLRRQNIPFELAENLSLLNLNCN